MSDKDKPYISAEHTIRNILEAKSAKNSPETISAKNSSEPIEDINEKQELEEQAALDIDSHGGAGGLKLIQPDNKFGMSWPGGPGGKPKLRVVQGDKISKPGLSGKRPTSSSRTDRRGRPLQAPDADTQTRDFTPGQLTIPQTTPTTTPDKSQVIPREVGSVQADPNLKDYLDGLKSPEVTTDSLGLAKPRPVEKPPARPAPETPPPRPSPPPIQPKPPANDPAPNVRPIAPPKPVVPSNPPTQPVTPKIPDNSPNAPNSIPDSRPNTTPPRTLPEPGNIPNAPRVEPAPTRGPRVEPAPTPGTAPAPGTAPVTIPRITPAPAFPRTAPGLEPAPVGDPFPNVQTPGQQTAPETSPTPEPTPAPVPSPAPAPRPNTGRRKRRGGPVAFGGKAPYSQNQSSSPDNEYGKGNDFVHMAKSYIRREEYEPDSMGKHHRRQQIQKKIIDEKRNLFEVVKRIRKEKSDNPLVDIHPKLKKPEIDNK